MHFKQHRPIANTAVALADKEHVTSTTIDLQQALKAVKQVVVDQEVVSQRKMALKGMFGQGKLDCWAVPSHELSTFVSSTFTDTQHEREVLVNDILPELRRLARPYQVQVCFLDMRFGVTDDATAMHEVGAIQVCFGMHSEPDICFFIFLADVG